jgi:hypothetical protein
MTAGVSRLGYLTALPEHRVQQRARQTSAALWVGVGGELGHRALQLDPAVPLCRKSTGISSGIAPSNTGSATEACSRPIMASTRSRETVTGRERGSSSR